MHRSPDDGLLRVSVRWVRRLVLLLIPALEASGALAVPGWRRTLITLAIGGLLAFGLAELFWPGLERFVGQRYLHSNRKPGRALVNLAVALAVTGAGLAL